MLRSYYIICVNLQHAKNVLKYPKNTGSRHLPSTARTLIIIFVRKYSKMNEKLADTLRILRQSKNLSQQQLADMLFVDRTTVANWEIGRRLPDAMMILDIAKALGVQAEVLLDPEISAAKKPVVILIDDETVVLNGTMLTLRDEMPQAEIMGFLNPIEAVDFAKENPVDIAFVDIEMGNINGLDICRELLGINPKTNVIFLTAYRDYSFTAWDTGACGFCLKPLTADALSGTLSHLRYPVIGI